MPRMTRALLSLSPTESIEGEPIAVVREKSEYEKEQERRQQAEEARRQEEAREAQSLIPLNPACEQELFASRNVGWECRRIARLMAKEGRLIIALTDAGAMLFLQLAKSMCRHFIEDEHWTEFDDDYAPAYEIAELARHFNKLHQQKLLPAATKAYIEQAWKELEATEANQEYGILLRLSQVFG